MNVAKKIQDAREKADYENHKGRIVWLTAERPLWSDGEYVDAHYRHVLLTQSRQYVKEYER